jgi:hypothetical protein
LSTLPAVPSTATSPALALAPTPVIASSHNKLLREILQMEKAIETSRCAIELVSSYPSQILPAQSMCVGTGTSTSGNNALLFGASQLLDLLRARKNIEEVIRALVTPQEM